MGVCVRKFFICYIQAVQINIKSFFRLLLFLTVFLAFAFVCYAHVIVIIFVMVAIVVVDDDEVALKKSA